MARADGPVVVCVINLKGGVGKSTISALLARAAFSDRELDVLAIDIDPQSNLSQALMHSAYNSFLSKKRPSIVEIFDGYKPPSSTSSSPSSLAKSDVVQLIASAKGRALELIPSRFDFSDNLVRSVRPDPRVLARFLTDNFQQKDLILIDCAPTESILTLAAYHASGLVLVPVKPEYFATIGFPLLNQSLANFQTQNRGHVISVCGVVINNAFYDGGNNGGPEKSRALREVMPRAVFHSRKPQRAIEYMGKARLGQTERGSYVLTILSPVSPQLNFHSDTDLFPEEPFERSVVRKLSGSVELAMLAAEISGGQDFEPFQSSVEGGVSANLCEAIAGFFGTIDASAIDLSVGWSLNRPLPNDETPSRVRIFGRPSLHQSSGVVFLTASSRGNWYSSPRCRSVFVRLCERNGLARKQSPREQWRTVFDDDERGACPSGFAPVEGVLAANFDGLATGRHSILDCTSNDLLNLSQGWRVGRRIPRNNIKEKIAKGGSRSDNSHYADQLKLTAFFWQPQLGMRSKLLIQI
jgi:chromosome partitioning protein